ncbi:MAG: hypothetical protein N2654_07540, partial [Deltaproteobacteria bacterium]|nr:hypothetical protein [Deltaproteobacteria bacterium]
MREIIVGLICVLSLFGCGAKDTPEKAINLLGFPDWVPFEYGLSYSGDKLPEILLEGDRFFAGGRLESAYLRYLSAQRLPSMFLKDLNHRIAAAL